jgi:hypothetical protein
MRKFGIGTLFVLLIAGIAVGSTALAGHNRDQNQFEATLRGFEETPAVSTSARGSFRLGIHGNTLVYRLRYSGMHEPVTAAHIHFGQRAVAGGVSAFLCGGGDKDPCPSPGGTVRGVIDAADVIGPEAQGIAAGELNELIRAIRRGVSYANVHSEMFPAGEIRGQIRPDRD